MELIYAMIAGGTGAGGAYAAVWAHLKFHKSYIDEHREQIKSLSRASNEANNRLTWLEARHGKAQ